MHALRQDLFGLTRRVFIASREYLCRFSICHRWNITMVCVSFVVRTFDRIIQYMTFCSRCNHITFIAFCERHYEMPRSFMQKNTTTFLPCITCYIHFFPMMRCNTWHSNRFWTIMLLYFFPKYTVKAPINDIKERRPCFLHSIRRVSHTTHISAHMIQYMTLNTPADCAEKHNTGKKEK